MTPEQYYLALLKLPGIKRTRDEIETPFKVERTRLSLEGAYIAERHVAVLGGIPQWQYAHYRVTEQGKDYVTQSANTKEP